MELTNRTTYLENLAERVKALETLMQKFGNPDHLLERIQSLEDNIYLNKNMFTLEEAAKYLGVTKSMLYKHTHNGSIPCYRPNGKMLYFDKIEVEAWLHRNMSANYEEKTEVQMTADKMVEEYLKEDRNGKRRKK